MTSAIEIALSREMDGVAEAVFSAMTLVLSN